MCATRLHGTHLGRWSINTVDIIADLTAGKGRPQWILSTYGPGRGAPASLLEGNEYSFEELRVRYYELARIGSQAQADEEAGSLWSKAEAAMTDVANNADKILQFMEGAEKKHPSRFDFCRFDGTKPIDEFSKELESTDSSGSSGFAQNPFGQPSSASGVFGTPATKFGQPPAPSAFGSPSFGQSSQPVAFGQPTMSFGQASATGFGRPALGSTGFGQPSFGQPSKPAVAFGQPSQTSTTFGQPSQPVSIFGPPVQPVLGFGQPSAPTGPKLFNAPTATSGFGQPSQPTSIFSNQPSQAGMTFGKQESSIAFGKSAQPTSFGQPPAFGQPSQPTAGIFGQPSQPPTISSFGAPSVPTPLFGQTSKSQPVNPFAKPATSTSGFGQRGQPANITGFGQTLQPNPDTYGTFGQPANGVPLPNNTSSNGKGARLGSASNTAHPLINKPPAALHYTETIPPGTKSINPLTKRLEMYKGRQVQYSDKLHAPPGDKSEVPYPCYERPDGQGWERVWFPEGDEEKDVVNLTREGKVGDLVPQESGSYNEGVIEEYRYLFENGRWKDGRMSRIPPMREWCIYDF